MSRYPEPIIRATDFFNKDDFKVEFGVYVKNFKGDREELVLINDGTADLTFTAGGIKNFKLKPGETFDEEMHPFSRLEVTATGAFRGYTRERADSPN
ncbi:hypothetical protein ABLO26_03560 [Neobacillus sp. 179-J 1A1 HS]|uniref:hypothetical protein n=1 Tax=Neobacillus driksii TaxID=3035913 RepID=UPI0035BBC394